MTTKLLAKKLAQFSFEKKAANVVLLDLRKLSDVADYFVVCSGESDTQVRAIANAIIENAKMNDIMPWKTEGLEYADWVIIDFVDIVVHVFHNTTRVYYNLEKLWGDAKIEHIEDKEEKKAAKKSAAKKPSEKKTAVKKPAVKKAATTRKKPTKAKAE